MDGVPSPSRSPMVDLAMMTKLLDDIYAALPKKEVKELLAGIARFNSQRKTREEIEAVRQLIIDKLSGHRHLLEKMNLLLPAKYSVVDPRYSSLHLQHQADGDEGKKTVVLNTEVGSPCGAGPSNGNGPMTWEEYAREVNQPNLQFACDAIEKLRMEVADDQAMSAFLHLLNDFISDKITRSDFMNRIPSSIKSNAAFESFIMQFLSNHQQVDVGQPEDPTKRRSSIQVVSTLVNDMTVKFWALKRQITERQLMNKTTEHIRDYAMGVIDLMCLKALLFECFGGCEQPDKDALVALFSEFDKIRPLKSNESALVLQELKSLLDRKPEAQTVRQEERHAVTESRPTPSYVPIPPFVRASCSASSMTELGHSVLQDSLMSTSTGSEDPETVQSSSSARHELCVQHQMRNPSQMLMDEAEDERFKVELVICRFHSTIEYFRKLMRSMHGMSDDEAQVYLRTRGLVQFGSQLSLLKSLYCEDWDEMREEVHNYPKRGIEVLYDRLNMKLQDWKAVLENETPKWEAIFRENYLRSLDYTYQMFQDNERNAFSLKSQMTEILRLKNESRGKRQFKHFTFTNLQDAVQQPHLTLNFCKREAMSWCSWGIEVGIAACHGPSTTQAATLFWKAFLSVFLCTHQDSTPSISAHLRSSPDIKRECTSNQLAPASETSDTKARGQSSAMSSHVLYCDENFYHLFHLFHSLYDRFGTLVELLKKKNASAIDVKALIINSLQESTRFVEIENQLTRLLGNDCYPLFNIAQLIKKIVFPMDKLMQSIVMLIFANQLRKTSSGASLPSGLPVSEVLRATQKEWSCLDEMQYFAEAKHASAQDAAFRVAYDWSKHALHIRHVMDDAEKLPHLENRLCPDRSILFCRRNLSVMHPPGNRRIAWPEYASSNQLKASVGTEQIKYQTSSEDWMVRTNKIRCLDLDIVDKKNAAMLVWLKQKSKE